MVLHRENRDSASVDAVRFFLADAHLDPSDPARSNGFARFLAGLPCPSVLYILGDLFNRWLGGDHVRMPDAREPVQAMRQAARRGVEIHVLWGNRDFHLDPAFGRAAGVFVDGESLAVRLDGIPTLLTHGDRFTARDRGFQRMGWVIRSAWARGLWLGLPLALRGALARWLERRSGRAVAEKGPGDLAPVAEEVARAFRAGFRFIICGHTHVALRRRMRVDGEDRELLVTGAWADGGQYLEYRDGIFQFRGAGG